MMILFKIWNLDFSNFNIRACCHNSLLVECRNLNGKWCIWEEDRSILNFFFRRNSFYNNNMMNMMFYMHIIWYLLTKDMQPQTYQLEQLVCIYFCFLWWCICIKVEKFNVFLILKQCSANSKQILHSIYKILLYITIGICQILKFEFFKISTW